MRESVKWPNIARLTNHARRALRQALMALFVMMIVGMTSCRQVVGIDDVSPPPTCRAPSSAAPSCADCLIDRCCTELSSCNSDPACAATFECVAACVDDDSCRASCEKAKGLPESSAALFTCRASRCDTACGLACGGVGIPISGCKPCGSTCCAEGATFSGDLDGQRLRTCRARCKPTDAVCLETCVNTHPEGADRERSALQCVARACGFDGDWSCVGHVEERRSLLPEITITFQMIDAQSLLPVPNVTLRGCYADDLSCTPPRFGSVMTNAQGIGQIKIPFSMPNFFDAYPGFIEGIHPDYVPGLLFFTPPIVANVQLRLAMLRRTEFARIEEASGVPSSEARGAIVFTAVDCGGRIAKGVSVHVQADKTDTATTRTFYTRNASAGGPSYDFNAAATTETGVGGILNVMPGNVELTITVDSLCLTIGRATVGVRAGTLTALVLPPLPSLR